MILMGLYVLLIYCSCILIINFGTGGAQNARGKHLTIDRSWQMVLLPPIINAFTLYMWVCEIFLTFAKSFNELNKFRKKELTKQELL